jgi:hypothetical protein
VALAEIRTGRVIYNNQAPISKRFDGMPGVRRHNGNHTRPRNLRSSIDRNLQLALDDFVNLFFGMEARYGRFVDGK